MEAVGEVTPVDRRHLADLYRLVTVSEDSDIVTQLTADQEKYKHLLHADITVETDYWCRCCDTFKPGKFNSKQTVLDETLETIRMGRCTHLLSAPATDAETEVLSTRLLYLATALKKKETVRFLLDLAKCLDIPNSAVLDVTPLSIAVQNSDSELVGILSPYVEKMAVGTGRPPLIETILSDSASLFEQLVASSHCDVDEVDNHGSYTALDIAAKKNSLWMVKRLLEAGADIKKAKRALFEAVEHNNSDMVLALTTAGAEVNGNQGRERTVTPLFKSVGMGSLEICQILLEAGANPNERTSHGEHVLPLLYFSQNSLEILKMLIHFGVDVNASDWSRNTTLHVACSCSYSKVAPACVNVLVAAGARYDVKNRDGETPLSLAVSHKCLDCVDILLPLGCNVNNANRKRNTPIHSAVSQGNLDLVRALVAAGADPNARNMNKSTPLCVAVCNGFVNIVRYLVSLNVDLEVPSYQLWFQTFDERTPLFFAVVHNHLEIIDVLLAAGYDVWRERWLTTGALMAEDVFLIDWEEKEKAINRLADLCRTVPSLQHRCKMVIRKTYGIGLSELLSRLNLPNSVKNYFLLKGIENQILCE